MYTIRSILYIYIYEMYIYILNIFTRTPLPFPVAESTPPSKSPVGCIPQIK